MTAHFRCRRAGFTLVELLVVLAVMIILASLTIMPLQGVLGGANLRGSGNSVVAAMNLARQTANTRNLSVDFRIYKVADASGNPVYRAVEAVIPASASGASADEYIGQPVILPVDIVFLADNTYSSLLNTSASTTLPPASGTEVATAPLSIRNQPYVKFTFLPNGALNLDSSVAWCLTLASQHAQAGTNGAPAKNYVAIVMDGQSGRPAMYQP